MFDASKDFNTTKARQLLEVYNKSRELDNAVFLNELINYQNKFSPSSILYRELLIKKCYEKETIVSVLSDLGYLLIVYKDHSSFGPKSKCSLIIFGIDGG